MLHMKVLLLMCVRMSMVSDENRNCVLMHPFSVQSFSMRLPRCSMPQNDRRCLLAPEHWSVIRVLHVYCMCTNHHFNVCILV